MATYTTHYNLKKPDASDFAKVTEDFNPNMEIIDDALFEANEIAVDAQASAYNANTSFRVTIPANAWTEYTVQNTSTGATHTFYKASADNALIKATSKPIVSLYVSSGSGAASTWESLGLIGIKTLRKNFGLIYRADTEDGRINFYATAIPSSTIIMTVKGV